MSYPHILIKMITEKNRIPLKLTIELVPSTVWYSSIYQYYKKSNNLQQWHEIKKELYAKEGTHCWICKKTSKPLQAHEFWEYDDVNRIQKLSAIHHLCGFCHKIKHIGLWLHAFDGERMLKKERLTKQDIIDHFCDVNRCSEKEFQKHEDEAFILWKERSEHKWKQDFGKYDPLLYKRKQENLSLKNFT